eukprot:403332335
MDIKFTQNTKTSINHAEIGIIEQNQVQGIVQLSPEGVIQSMYNDDKAQSKLQYSSKMQQEKLKSSIDPYQINLKNELPLSNQSNPKQKVAVTSVTTIKNKYNQRAQQSTLKTSKSLASQGRVAVRTSVYDNNQFQAGQTHKNYGGIYSQKKDSLQSPGGGLLQQNEVQSFTDYTQKHTTASASKGNYFHSPGIYNSDSAKFQTLTSAYNKDNMYKVQGNSFVNKNGSLKAQDSNSNNTGGIN